MTKEGYKDDYLDVYSKWPLEEYLIQNIQPLCPNAKMKLFVYVTYNTLDHIPTDGKEFDASISIELNLFVDSSTCTEEEFLELRENVEHFFHEHRIEVEASLYYEKPGYLDEMNDSNYFEYFKDEYYLNVLNFDYLVDYTKEDNQ